MSVYSNNHINIHVSAADTCQPCPFSSVILIDFYMSALSVFKSAMSAFMCQMCWLFHVQSVDSGVSAIALVISQLSAEPGICRRNQDFCETENRRKIFSVEKNRQAYFFFSMKIKMMDLSMQIEGKNWYSSWLLVCKISSNLPPECLKLHL